MGVLDQLPNLDELNQARDAIPTGLAGIVGQAGDVTSFTRPLTDALAPLQGQLPDLDGLIAPLDGMREQLAGQLPGGLDEQIVQALPLARQAEQALSSDVLAPILNAARAGKPIAEIAQAQVSAFVQQVAGAASAYGSDQLRALTAAATDLAAAANVVAGGGNAPDPARLAGFLGERVFGLTALTAQPIQAAITLWDALLAAAEGAPGAIDQGLDAAEQAVAAQLSEVLVGLESLDLTSDASWQSALATLQAAQTEFSAFRQRLAAVPNAVNARLSMLNPDTYRRNLRRTLQPLVGGTPDATATLARVGDAVMQPLDALIARVEGASPETIHAALGSALDQLEAAFDAVEAAITAIGAAIEAGLQAVSSAITSVAGEFANVRQRLDDAFAALGEALQQINAESLAEAVGGLLDQVNEALAAIKLDGLKTLLDQALGAVDGLVKQLSEAVENALQQLDTLGDSLKAIRFGPLAQPVLDAIDDIKDKLASLNFDELPDAAKALIAQAIDAFKGQFDGDFKQFFDEEVVKPLNDGYDEATTSVQGAVETAQGKLTQFNELVGKLDPAQLLKPVTDIYKQLTDAITDLNGQGIMAPARALLDDAKEALQEAAPQKLLAPLEQAFEQHVLTPLNALKPSALLKPLADAFGRFIERLRGINLAGAIDWQAALAGALATFRPSNALAPLQTALDSVAARLSNATDALLMDVFGQLAPLTAAPGLVNGAALSQALAQHLQPVTEALELHQPATVAARLAPLHARAVAALGRVEPALLTPGLRRRYDAAQAALAALDPQPFLDDLRATFDALVGAVRGLPNALDFSDLTGEFGNILQGAAGRLPSFLSNELTPAAIRQALPSFSPARLFQQFDERFAALSATLQRFVPQALFERLQQLAERIRVALEGLSPQRVGERLDQVFAQMMAAITALHPRAITERLQSLFDDALAKLDDLTQRLVAHVTAALDAALGRIRDVVKALDPQAILAGLGNFFNVIKQALDKLNLTELLARLLKIFDGLKADLTSTLKRAAAKFGEMATAVEALA
jgi:hypothetical protein